MRVEFWRDDEARVAGWDVMLPGRRPVRGSTMGLGSGLTSHDLVQFVVEAVTNSRNGFWGLVSQGATFRSMKKTRTKPGRAVIAKNRSALDDSEKIAAMHVASWRGGERTPVTIALTKSARQFQQLQPGDRLVFHWPSAEGQIVRRAQATSPTLKRKGCSEAAVRPGTRAPTFQDAGSRQSRASATPGRQPR